MIKRIGLLMIVMACFLAEPADSQESLQVVVLPFDIYSQEDLSYMAIEIPGVILKQLTEDGAKVVDVNIAAGLLPKSGSRTVEEFRKIGIQTGSDYIVWGSLTWIGTKFSLDVKMAEAIGESPPEVFFIEGEGIENLFGKVKELARDIGFKIFKWKKLLISALPGITGLSRMRSVGKFKQSLVIYFRPELFQKI